MYVYIRTCADMVCVSSIRMMHVCVYMCVVFHMCVCVRD